MSMIRIYTVVPKRAFSCTPVKCWPDKYEFIRNKQKTHHKGVLLTQRSGCSPSIISFKGTELFATKGSSPSIEL